MRAFYNQFEMRCVARDLLLAALVAAAGCTSSPKPDPVVAEITSITAPDTVAAGVKFDVSVHAILGYHIGYVLEDTAVVRSTTLLYIRVWARDEWRGTEHLPAISECDLMFKAGPAEPGEFRVIAHQPDGGDTGKTIAVLP